LRNIGCSSKDRRTAFHELSKVKQMKIIKNARQGTNYLETRGK